MGQHYYTLQMLHRVMYTPYLAGVEVAATVAVKPEAATVAVKVAEGLPLT
jgi:hypothetical protein